MALDREKTFLNAERLLKQGKTAQALDECRRLAEDGPKDLLMLNRLGDFLARNNRGVEAIAYYEMIVSDFSASGFYPKAIAILKKIIKVDPNHMSAIVRLGDLNIRQKLPGEARSWYLQAADTYLKSSDFGKAREVFEKLIQADPSNLTYAARLADAAAAAGDTERAGMELVALAKRMLGAGATQDAERALKRAQELLPGRAEPLIALARCQAERGAREEALALADRAWANPSPAAGLADEVFLLYEMLSDARRSSSLLLDPRSDALSDEAIEQAFKAAVVRDDTEGLWSRMTPLLERCRRNRQLDRLSTRLEHIARIEDGGYPHALEQLVEIRKSEANRPAAARALERLIRAYQARGAVDKVEAQLSTLKGLDPASPLLFVGRGAGGAPLAERPADQPAVSSAFDAPAVPVSPADQEFVSGNMTEAEVFEKYGLRREALQQLKQITERFPGHVPAQEKLVGFLRTQNDRAALRDGLIALAFAKRARGEGDAARRAAGEAVAIGGLEPAAREALERLSLMTHEAGAAVPSPIAGSAEPPARPTVAATPPPLTTPVTRAEEEDLEILFDDAEEGVPADGLIGTEALEEIKFYLDQGMIQDALNRIAQARAAGVNPAALDALAERARIAQAGAPTEQENAAAAEGAELLDEADLSSITAALEASFGEPTAETEEEPAASPESEQSVEQVFDTFKEHVKASVEAGDFRTHYDLGIAYKEMGLLDDALAEFRVAAGTPELFREACSMMGVCHRERGEMDEAIRWYRSAIDAPGADEVPLSGLRYELAALLEERGDLNGAYDLLSVVASDDPGFRDAATRAGRLRKKLGI